jgi:hypothetical protein
MNRTVLMSGAIGAIVAFALISVTVFVLPGIDSTNATITSTTTVSPSSTKTEGPLGTFSALITDPPTVPIGTTDVYMSYSSIEVHIAGAGNSSEYWYSVGSPGTIDLMQSINISDTIGLASIPAGTSFDQIRFNVTSVTVAFDKGNYSAQMLMNENKVLAEIPGGVTVGALQTQAVLIDMSPKVLLMGSSPGPTFAFLPTAKAFVFPTSDIPAQARILGGRSDLEANLWWRAISVMTHFEITGLNLSPGGVQINVTNTGNTSVVFRLVTITPSANSTYGPSIPVLTQSAVYAISANASLLPLSGSNKSAIIEELATNGYVLSPAATVTFTYSSSIQIGLIQFGAEYPSPSSLVNSQQYIVRLFGNDAVAYQVQSIN